MSQKICPVQSCDKPIHAKGFCSKHFQRLKAFGNPTYLKIRPLYLPRACKVIVKTKCTVDGCGNAGVWKRMCEKHYARYYKYGDATKVTKVVGENRTAHPLYKLYHAMIGRCTNENYKYYRYYGGRGITVCERWRGQQGFANFIADMGDRPDSYTLDRVDNSKGYSPDNCRWASRTEQQINRRLESKNTSGVKGVHRYKANNSWTAYIDVKRTRRHLGYFGTKAEAIKARQEAEKLRDASN